VIASLNAIDHEIMTSNVMNSFSFEIQRVLFGRYIISFCIHIYLLYLEAYRAFLGAHTSMNKIQLYIRQIPEHLKTVMLQQNLLVECYQ
jgi:hypothetical protein